MFLGSQWSSITGRITAGLFDGVLHLQNESYYLEPSVRHFSSPVNFHSIVYKASSVTFNSSDALSRGAYVHDARIMVQSGSKVTVW